MMPLLILATCLVVSFLTGMPIFLSKSRQSEIRSYFKVLPFTVAGGLFSGGVTWLLGQMLLEGYELFALPVYIFLGTLVGMLAGTYLSIWFLSDENNQQWPT